MYGGVPAGLNALALCKAAFEERGIAFMLSRVHDTTEAPDRPFERGAQLRRQYMGISSTARPRGGFWSLLRSWLRLHWSLA